MQPSALPALREDLPFTYAPRQQKRKSLRETLTVTDDVGANRRPLARSRLPQIWPVFLAGVEVSLLLELLLVQIKYPWR